MKVRRLGITRIVSEEEYKNYWKSRGYEIVEEEDKLEDMSHNELYEIAQKYDIDGRSKMSKEDLIEAIRGVE